MENSEWQIGTSARMVRREYSNEDDYIVTGTGNLSRCRSFITNHKRWNEIRIDGTFDLIEDECFKHDSIKQVLLRNNGSFRKIGNRCFRSSMLETIVLPETLESIGHNNFCGNITSFNIPSKIASFPVDNLIDCQKLVEISVSEGNCSYKTIDGILYNYDVTEIVFCPNAKSGKVVIPNTVKRIGDYCFADCKCLSTIIIPTSVEGIGNFAFKGIVLDKLTIRNSVREIGAGCFFSAKIKDFRFSHQVNTIPDNSFERLEVNNEFNHFVHLKRIGKAAFANGYARSFPSKISLDILEEIAENSFAFNYSIFTFELFSSLKIVREGAFAKINNNCLFRYFSFAPIRICDNALDEIGCNATLVVPKGTKTVFENAVPWSSFPNIEEWDLNIDKDSNGEETIVSDDIYGKRLQSVAESITNVDRVYLQDIISDMFMDYLYVETDEEYVRALALIDYNRSFSPAIIPDLEQRICKNWASKYKLKLINKILIDSPATPLMMTGHVNEVALPATEVLSLPSSVVESVPSSNNVSVFFNEDILKQLQNNLAVAQKTVKIAVSWFTNYTLFKQLKDMSESDVKTQLIINNDLINNGGYCLDLNQLIDSGVEISLVEYPHLLHHKFCIIDDTVVISGSYNWTRFSAKNYENIIVIKDNEDIVDQFNEEFNNILSSAEHKCIDKMPDQVPVHPEYDRSAFKQYITEELDAQARETSDERDKITALQKAARLNPEYLEMINPKVRDKYTEAFKVVEDAADIQKNIVAMVENEPASATNQGSDSRQPTTATSALSLSKSNTPPSGNSAAPSNAQTTVTHAQSHTITQKEAAIIQQIKASSLVMVLDVSGSMNGTYQQGHVHSITKKALSAALSITDTKEVAIWTFGDDASFIGNIGLSKLNEIESIRCLGQSTNLIKFVEKANSSILDEALVIIFTDDDPSSIQNAIPGMKNRPNVFWQIIVYGTDSTNISNAISDAGNTSVVSMTNYAAMDDAAISQALLKDYITCKKGRLNK